MSMALALTPKELAVCRMCGSDENLMKHAKKKNGSGYYFWCRECNREVRRKYASTKSGSKVIRDHNSKSRVKFKQKGNARSILSYHVRKGRISKPDCCDVCKIEVEPQGHHPNYDDPLNVIWVCRSCHAYLHKK